MLQEPVTFDGLLFDAESKGAAFLAALKAMETHVDNQLVHCNEQEKTGQLEVMCRIWESIGLAQGSMTELKTVEGMRTNCRS